MRYTILFAAALVLSASAAAAQETGLNAPDVNTRLEVMIDARMTDSLRTDTSGDASVDGAANGAHNSVAAVADRSTTDGYESSMPFRGDFPTL